MTNQEKARKLIPIVQAMAEGKTIQYRDVFRDETNWFDLDICKFNPDNNAYCIKAETIQVNGIEAPKPENNPLQRGQVYWYV